MAKISTIRWLALGAALALGAPSLHAQQAPIKIGELNSYARQAAFTVPQCLRRRPALLARDGREGGGHRLRPAPRCLVPGIGDLVTTCLSTYLIVEARRRKGQLILLDSDVNGMKVNIILDTGANFSVGNLALRDKLVRKKRAPAPASGGGPSSGGGGGACRRPGRPGGCRPVARTGRSGHHPYACPRRSVTPRRPRHRPGQPARDRRLLRLSHAPAGQGSRAPPIGAVKEGRPRPPRRRPRRAPRHAAALEHRRRAARPGARGRKHRGRTARITHGVGSG